MENSEVQTDQSNEFEAVKARLEEIAQTVDDESLSLDQALDLYEEAVKLGLQATNLLEVGIEVDAESDAQDGAEADAAANGEVGTQADGEGSAPAPDGVPGTNPDAIPAPTPFQNPDSNQG